MISCWNRGRDAFTIEVGERIAQLVVVPVHKSNSKSLRNFRQSARGAGGFGHTGKE